MNKRAADFTMHALELKVPPVAQFLIAAVLMWGLSAATPGAAFGIPGSGGLAAISGAAGVVIGVLGVIAFRGAGTTVDPRAPHATTRLVRNGVYRVSRNPMYLGILLVLIGWALYLSNALAFVLLPVFVAYMNRFQIRPEERHMVEKFGDEYRTYTAGVRRWI